MEQDGLNVKSELPTKLDLATIEASPLKLSAKEKKKHKKQLTTAMMFAKYGLSVLKVKASTLAALGNAATDAGIKAIGHGKVMVASEHSEQAIARVNELIDELQQSDKSNKHELIIDLMKLLREFNGQLLHTAQVHFNADKQLTAPPGGPHLTMPFPAGQALLVAPMPQKAEAN